MPGLTHVAGLGEIPERRHIWAALLAAPRPLVMGVLNVTPDSFADGGRFFDPDAALAQARALVVAGADILDIGGESTRPFADPVPLDEELRRVLPVIETLAPEITVPISIDTYKAKVARAALSAGATLINDISALRFDPEMAPLAAEMQAPVVLMHMQGTPRDMQRQPHYHNLLGELRDFFQERLDFAASRGLAPELLVLDPGIGFGKTGAHNLEILNHLEVFLDLGAPILLGPSRKAFIGRLTGQPAGEERDIGTLAALALAVLRGARIVRTHNVAYARQFLAVLEAIRSAPTGASR
jgi:dihydropteroate synthase